MRTTLKLILFSLATLIFAAIMVAWTVCYLLFMAACFTVCGIFLTFAAMAFLMWTLSHQLPIWQGMIHALDLGLVVGAVPLVLLIVQGLLSESPPARGRGSKYPLPRRAN